MLAAWQRPRLALVNAAPKDAEKLGRSLWSLCPEDSSEEHMELAEVLHSSAGCDHSEETKPCVKIGFWEHCWVPSPAVLQLLSS